MVFDTKDVTQIKEKAIDTYRKLVDIFVKPIILYACECCRDSWKTNVFVDEIEKFHFF